MKEKLLHKKRKSLVLSLLCVEKLTFINISEVCVLLRSERWKAIAKKLHTQKKLRLFVLDKWRLTYGLRVSVHGRPSILLLLWFFFYWLLQMNWLRSKWKCFLYCLLLVVKNLNPVLMFRPPRQVLNYCIYMIV